MKSFFIGWAGCCLLLTSACSSDVNTNGDVQESVFSGGLFELETYEVNDSCLDGGLDLVFMPNGTNAPYVLAENNELPALDELPSNQTIKLQAPFDSMIVDITAGENGSMQIRDAAQLGVVVDESQWGQCTADMNINADITVVDDDNVIISATVQVEKWTDGSAAPDDECPASDSCTVTLGMRGRRVQ